MSSVNADSQMIKASAMDARHAYVVDHIITKITLTTQTALACAVGTIIGNHEPLNHQGRGASGATRTSTS